MTPEMNNSLRFRDMDPAFGEEALQEYENLKDAAGKLVVSTAPIIGWGAQTRLYRFPDSFYFGTTPVGACRAADRMEHRDHEYPVSILAYRSPNDSAIYAGLHVNAVSMCRDIVSARTMYQMDPRTRSVEPLGYTSVQFFSYAMETSVVFDYDAQTTSRSVYIIDRKGLAPCTEDALLANRTVSLFINAQTLGIMRDLSEQGERGVGALVQLLPDITRADSTGKLTHVLEKSLL